jgi:Tfp pilus assembly protein PilP
MVGCEGDGQQTGPTTAELSRERTALAAKVKTRKGKAAKRSLQVAPPAESDAPSFGAVELGFTYDLAGKRDPFRSFQWEQLALAQMMASSYGPLGQYDVDQLSLIAIVWKTGAAKALVQDPSGQSYIVGNGAKIGKNKGTVVDIDDNLVVVKETYVDYLGQETTKDIEMRIRRLEGG